MSKPAWGYGPDNGPDKWGETFPICNGAQQSPIDIVHKDAQHDRSLKALKVKFNAADAKGLVNTGYQFQVTFIDDGDTTTLSGGPITGTYRLKQFHFHWGGGNDRGSEHTVNGVKFPCELHLVYWNPKYASFADAVKQCDGLAVVGVFLKIGAANPSLQKVLDALDSIKCKGQQTDFPNFNTATLLPDALEYWTYDGSLTTPPTLECVKWIVLKDAISVSPAQMDGFRKVLFNAEGEEACCMVDNYRPPQPLKGRKVRCSFLSMSS